MHHNITRFEGRILPNIFLLLRIQCWQREGRNPLFLYKVDDSSIYDRPKIQKVII
jgi:hypothetical protein